MKIRAQSSNANTLSERNPRTTLAAKDQAETTKSRVDGPERRSNYLLMVSFSFKIKISSLNQQNTDFQILIFGQFKFHLLAPC